MNAKTKRIPANACLLRAGAVDLVDVSDVDSSTVARILARSGKPIEHPYWGNLAHDFAGMEQVKDRLPLDYCHDAGDIIGFAENWGSADGDLRCEGTLLTGKSERAAEVVSLAQSGVPYEASISFTPLAVQYLGDGETADVNGRMVDGPASIVRRWRLTGLAVCPRGADPYTQTELSAAGEFVVDVLSKGTDDMTESLDQLSARIQQELTDRITDYTAKFGQQGQAWALSNRPQAECYADLTAQLREQHATELATIRTGHESAIAELQAKVDAQAATVTDLTQRLESLALGEKVPLSTAPAEVAESQLTPAERAGLTPNLQQYVSAQRAAKAKK
jgi:hypothetical protein